MALADTRPPVFVELPTACNVTDRLIQVCLRSDEPASLVLDYGLAPDALTRSEARALLDPQHSLAIGGLTPNTTYFLRAKVRDQAGNETLSPLLQATTLRSARANPVFVQAPTVAYEGADRAVIEWQTDRPCTGLIEGTVGGAPLRFSDGEVLTRHSVVLTNLTPGTSYQFRVTATDIDGLRVVSDF